MRALSVSGLGRRWSNAAAGTTRAAKSRLCRRPKMDRRVCSSSWLVASASVRFSSRGRKTSTGPSSNASRSAATDRALSSSDTRKHGRDPAWASKARARTTFWVSLGPNTLTGCLSPRANTSDKRAKTGSLEAWTRSLVKSLGYMAFLFLVGLVHRGLDPVAQSLFNSICRPAESLEHLLLLVLRDV